ncbi:MAG: hypothetical protein IAE83_05685 [Anaerolinea sp.]|nr:hypothetical protein [Anaerolinea sp.]
MPASEAARYRGYWDPPLLSFSSSLNARSYSARAAELRDQISVQGRWYRRFSGDKGNIAIIDYDISGIGEGTIFAHSGKRAASGTAPYIAESSERYFRTIIYRELDRSIDAEAKALEALARRLGATNPPSFEYRLPGIRGTVDLFTELLPCESCGGLTGMNGVIGQFRFLFPNVKVNVHWSR